MKLRSILSLIAIITVAFASQLLIVDPASAADTPSDLQASVQAIMHNQLYADRVCNNGPSDVTSFTVQYSYTNYSPDFTISLPSYFGVATATDTGTFDNTTKVWTGLVKTGECVGLGTGGVITGEVGETIVHDFAIVSSVLSDDSVNVDPNSGNDSIQDVSPAIIAQSDIAITTRLKTSGAIQTGSTVNYEVTYSNVGVGDYFNDGSTQLPLGLYFIMPTGSTLGSITDIDTNDNITIASCNTIGPSSNLGPGAAPYPGIVAGCNLNLSGVIAPGESFALNMTLTAGADFASGATGVWAIGVADEPDVMLFQVMAQGGVDMFEKPSNNYTNLVYDNAALQATVARCPGQTETTTDGTGCFRVSFNKDIPEGEFDASDIDLDGKGSVSNFTQIGDNLWEVQVSGIAQGATLALILNADSIRDFSYVANAVQVLGENTIRFADPTATPTTPTTQAPIGAAAGTTSANGTLAATGVNSDWQIAIGLMLAGLMILLLTKAKIMKPVC